MSAVNISSYGKCERGVLVPRAEIDFSIFHALLFRPSPPIFSFSQAYAETKHNIYAQRVVSRFYGDPRSTLRMPHLTGREDRFSRYGNSTASYFLARRFDTWSGRAVFPIRARLCALRSKPIS